MYFYCLMLNQSEYLTGFGSITCTEAFGGRKSRTQDKSDYHNQCSLRE